MYAITTTAYLLVLSRLGIHLAYCCRCNCLPVSTTGMMIDRPTTHEVVSPHTIRTPRQVANTHITPTDTAGWIEKCRPTLFAYDRLLILYWSALMQHANSPHITSCGAKAQQTPPPYCSIARFLGMTKNVIRSPHGHSTLPWKFHANRSSRFLVINLADKQTNKQIYRSKTDAILLRFASLYQVITAPRPCWALILDGRDADRWDQGGTY